jgi:hypothetical protein
VLHACCFPISGAPGPAVAHSNGHSAHAPAVPADVRSTAATAAPAARSADGFQQVGGKKNRRKA